MFIFVLFLIFYLR